VVTLGLTVFGHDLASEPHFADESAYLSQSFFADLFLDGKWDDPAWLTYGGYDLPPLPKYLIGGALRAGGYRRPGPSAMWAWYDDTSRQFVPIGALTLARWPSVILGAAGCLAIYALGTMAVDRRVGLLSALLLMANPLYAMHARRAMSDVPAEALILSTAAVGLWAWIRLLSGRGVVVPALGLAIGSGVLGGLATLAKLNGALGGFILAGWAALAIGLPVCSKWGRAAFVVATVGAGFVSFGTFAALNPFLTARPAGPIDPSLAATARLTFAGRVHAVAEHRVGVSARAPSQFPNDALTTPRDKVGAVLVQGFGRFGPLGPRGRTDSTVRFDRRQDVGALAWLPWVVAGLGFAVRKGREQIRAGGPPASWAIVAQAAVAGATVTAFIPLAWDRYFLSIQPGSAILGAIAAVGLFDLARSAIVRESPPEPAP